jgi:L-seryl-tRNA(Ser) seleniumtransferase
MKRHPLLRALRIDKLLLAMLKAVLALYESAQGPERLVPALRMLSELQDAIAWRAQRLPGLECRVAAGASLADGGSLPGDALPTWTLHLCHAALSPDKLAQRLRRRSPALVGRIQSGRCTLDLRTVVDGELRDILHAAACAPQ